MNPMQESVNMIYEAMHVPFMQPIVEDYDKRHGIKSAAILTIDFERAELLMEHLRKRIKGKIVLDLGGGTGLLGCALALYAKKVFVIEANPCWSFVYAVNLYKHKPKNLTYIFGAASELRGLIHADVVLFCTHSGHEEMRKEAKHFGDTVIDVYAEILKEIGST